MAAKRLSLLRRMVAVARDILKTPTLALWGLMLFSFPLYHVGALQPGFILSLVAILVALRSWDGRLGGHAIRPLRGLIYLIIWITLVDEAWGLILARDGLFSRDGFILYPGPYYYTGLVFLSGLILFRRYGERFLTVTTQFVFITALFQVFLAFTLVRGGGRGQLLFNNPNQLGFYAVLSSSIITLGGRRAGLRTIPIAIGLCACAFLALMSASKAALAGSVVLLALALVTNLRMFLVTTLMLGAIIAAGGATNAIERASDRISSQDASELYEGRGYDRIWDNKQYWLLGAGEGGFDRFEDTSIIGDHELHSAAGTIFFSYGIVGVLLFANFLAKVVRGMSWRGWLALVPPLAYGLAHQALRFTLFWVLLVMLVALAAPRQQAPPEKKPP